MEEIDRAAFQSFYLKNIDRTQQNFKPQHEKIYKRLIAIVEQNKSGCFFAVKDTDENIQAALLLLHHQTRLINIINVASAEGKKSGASHFLFSGVIQQNAGQNKLFDFEGSSVSSIAKFYEGFGAQPENFWLYETNIFRKLSQRFS